MSYSPTRESPPPLPHSNGSSPPHHANDYLPSDVRHVYDSDAENSHSENPLSNSWYGNPPLENSSIRGVLPDDEQDAINRMEMDDEIMNEDDDEVNNHQRYDDEVTNHRLRYNDDNHDDDDDDDGDLGVRSGPRGGILVRGGDVGAGGGYVGPSRPTNLSGTTGPVMGCSFSHASAPPALSNIPLSSPDHHSTEARGGITRGVGCRAQPPTSQAVQSVTSPHSKLDSLRSWSFNTYKFTRQVLSEKLGRVSRTVDTELEAQIELLRDTQAKYTHILRLTNTLAQHFSQVACTQRALGEAFSDLSQKNPELREEFSYNAETQRVLYKNGETLLAALQFFTSTMNTLCNKTMDDTLLTIKHYEAARVEYDAYRMDLEYWTSPAGGATQPPRDGESAARYEEVKRRYESHRDKFERLRADVTVKIKFLDENRVKVMHKQLLLLHNAIASYFSGNQTALQDTLKQFNIKLKTPNSDQPSWLETHSPS